jgi:hypothetical protein
MIESIIRSSLASMQFEVSNSRATQSRRRAGEAFTAEFVSSRALFDHRKEANESEAIVSHDEDAAIPKESVYL